MEQNMFCYQCQETAGCKGCTRIGVCGKTAQVAAMQDLLVYVSKGLSAVTTQLRKEGKTIDSTVNHMVTLNLFVTITNANFDEDMIVTRILDTLNCKEKLLSQVDNPLSLPDAAFWYAKQKEDLERKAAQVGVLAT
ncbi:MAG: hydroxylamine reductase, partial [Anaerotignum sp.]|nr:hydroxylamine reductase [Anaerotignum sp.]